MICGIESQTMNIERDASTMRSSPATRCWNISRRYILAIMCNLAFFLRAWTITNMAVISYHVRRSNKRTREVHFPTMVDFTWKEFQEMHKIFESTFIIGQIPAVVLIIIFSPNQIMRTSVIVSSVLQLITPATIQISYALYIANIVAQSLFACPLDSATIGLLGECAPSTERTGLLMVSFSGQYIYYLITVPLCLFLLDNVSPVSPNYFAGMTGILWWVLWKTIDVCSSLNDQLILENEFKYITENVYLPDKEKITLSSIPLKSMFKSIPVLVLCFVFISYSLSFHSMTYFGNSHLLLPLYEDWVVWLVLLNSIVLVPAAGYFIDFVINRKIAETTTMRKVLCSGGFILHAVFMVLSLIPGAFVCIKISLLIFPYTLAGALPNVLDLSTRFSCVIMGAAMTVFSISQMLWDLFLDHILVQWTPKEWIISFIPVEILAILAAIAFAVFGSGKEQAWSKPPPSHEEILAVRRGQTEYETRQEDRDSQYYPQTNV